MVRLISFTTLTIATHYTNMVYEHAHAHLTTTRVLFIHFTNTYTYPCIAVIGHHYDWITINVHSHRACDAQ